jgi:hypothetical protein
MAEQKQVKDVWRTETEVRIYNYLLEALDTRPAFSLPVEQLMHHAAHELHCGIDGVRREFNAMVTAGIISLTNAQIAVCYREVNQRHIPYDGAPYVHFL